MSARTLVLSPGYQAIKTVTWERAVTLLFQGKVEVVEEYEDREVRSVTLALKVPSIIRHLTEVPTKKKAIKFSRQNVYQRDGGKCQYCCRAVAQVKATYDHVKPRAQGGQTTWENVVIACVPCNQRKGAPTPEQAGMALRQKPVRPKALPDMRILVAYTKGMPKSWKQFVQDQKYWTGELEHD